MKRHLFVFLSLLGIFNGTYSSAYEPEKQALIDDVRTLLVQEYAEEILAPTSDPTCELDMQALYDFLQQRIENSSPEELTFLNNRSKSMRIQEWHTLLNTNHNLRVNHYYRLKVSCAWQCQIGIEFDCLLKHWDDKYSENAKKVLRPVESHEMVAMVRTKYPAGNNDILNQRLLETSHAFAQEALRLFFSETNQ